MIQIRDATSDDLDVFVSLGARMYEECTVSYPPVEEEHIRKYLDVAVTMPNVFLNLIAEDDGPIGILTAVAGPYSFSPKLRTSSDILFVLPEKRGGRAAILLVGRFNEWADSIGAVNSTMSIATGVTPKRTGRFFEMMGFRPMEMIYRRDNVYGS
jgi:GNAT superfamily N-acetyltransferase